MEPHPPNSGAIRSTVARARTASHPAALGAAPYGGEGDSERPQRSSQLGGGSPAGHRGAFLRADRRDSDQVSVGPRPVELPEPRMISSGLGIIAFPVNFGTRYDHWHNQFLLFAVGHVAFKGQLSFSKRTC
eukprot:764242-Hanusia_phi.AAC.1